MPSYKVFSFKKNALTVNLYDVVPAPFMHDQMNFQMSYKKTLTSDEVNSGFLVSDLFC